MGWNFSGIALLTALAALLVSAGIEDIRIREIANRKNAAIALLAPLWWWSQAMSPWPQLGVAIAVFALFCVAFHFGMMGGGDVKMIGALALWFPFQPLLAMLIIMSVAGGAITLVMLIDRKIRKNQGLVEVPYGVAIAIAGLITLGKPILNHFQ